jgi:transcriptional regulator with XRE-family HTH domain
MATKKVNPRRKKLASIMKDKREQKGLSLYAVKKKMCTAAGDAVMSETQLKNIEDGVINFTIDTLLAYLDAIDLRLKIVESDEI